MRELYGECELTKWYLNVDAESDIKKTADSKTLLNDETKCFFVSTFATHQKV